MTFQFGDRVKVVRGLEAIRNQNLPESVMNSTGEITSLLGDSAHVEFDGAHGTGPHGRHRGWYVPLECLALGPKTRVQITAPAEYAGLLGTINTTFDKYCTVRLDNTNGIVIFSTKNVQSIRKGTEMQAPKDDATLAAYKKMVLAVALRAKKNNDWCKEEFDAAMKELNIPVVVDDYPAGTVFASTKNGSSYEHECVYHLVKNDSKKWLAVCWFNGTVGKLYDSLSDALAAYPSYEYKPLIREE